MCSGSERYWMTGDGLTIDLRFAVFVVLTFERLLLFYWIILISVVRVIAGVPSLEGDSTERLGRQSRTSQQP